MPAIGNYSTLWEELCAVELTLKDFVTDEVRKTVDDFIQDLPKPIVLIHSQGNTGKESKNLSDVQELDLYRGLLDRINGCIILLDFDSRVRRLKSYRVRHLGDDWKALNLVELWYLISQSQLGICVDSGIQHFFRFTKTPCLGVWSGHYPSHYAMPRSNTAHLVASNNRHRDWNRYRLNWNVVEVGEMTGDIIADHAARMLATRWLTNPAKDLLLQWLVSKCRHYSGHLSDYVDRHKSFSLVFDWLKTRNNPVVVSTGSIRAEMDFGAGFFDYLCGLFLSEHGGTLTVAELDHTNVAFARKWTSGFPVSVVQSDSRDFLRDYQGTIDLLYLDSADIGTPDYEAICLDEVKYGLSKLANGGKILIDDTVYSSGQWRGKGSAAVPFLLSNSFQILYSGYQCLLAK